MSVLDDYSSFEETAVAEQVAQRVFEEKLQNTIDRIAKQEALSFNIIIGAIVALFLVIGGLAYSTWLFMAEYNQHYIEAKQSFLEETMKIRVENKEMLDKLERHIETKHKKMI